MVSIDPGDERRQSSFYYGPPPTLGVAKHAPVGVVIDPVARRSLSSHVVAASWDILSRECTLPRAVAMDDERARAFVACMSTDVVHVLDATAADPMAAVIGRFEAPSGPSGLALDAAGETLVIWGEIASRVRVMRILDGETIDIDVESASSAEHRRGRELFYAGDDRGISFDGLACASCHPDGNDDGLTWITPEGPRQTPMLAGRLAGTAPYGWDRGSTTLEAYASETIARLRGQGLADADLRHLARYIEGLPGPPARAATDQAARGREIFFAEGCGTCHTEGIGTDHERHALERRDAVDTPSLRSVSMTAPYFHDGRYRTLDGLLVHSEMGGMQKIDGQRKALLLEYLESL
jgi:cytochrome c553